MWKEDCTLGRGEDSWSDASLEWCLSPMFTRVLVFHIHNVCCFSVCLSDYLFVYSPCSMVQPSGIIARTGGSLQLCHYVCVCVCVCVSFVFRQHEYYALVGHREW